MVLLFFFFSYKMKTVEFHDISDSLVSKSGSALTGSGSCPSCLSERARLALRMLPSELGLLLPRQQQPHHSWRGCVQRLGLIIPLLALMWFVRLYLHYWSQWLYLQAIAVPVNKWVCFLWYCPECTYTAQIHLQAHTEQNCTLWTAHSLHMESGYIYRYCCAHGQILDANTCTHKQHVKHVACLYTHI